MNISIRSTLAAITMAMLTAGAASAQGTIAGKWVFEFNRRVSDENGQVTESDPARVRLTMALTGDSVSGNWQVIASNGEAVTGALRVIHGHVSGGKFRVETDAIDSVVRDDTGERTIKTTTVLDFTMSGDELVGTRTVVAGGGDAGPSRPFKAVREKA